MTSVGEEVTRVGEGVTSVGQGVAGGLQPPQLNRDPFH